MRGEVIKELDRDGPSACLYRLGDDYFVISSISVAPDHGGPETLAFAADAEGEITDWSDVAGGRGWSREETIAELEKVGPDPESAGRGIFGDTEKLNERGAEELRAGTLSSLGVIARASGSGDYWGES